MIASSSRAICRQDATFSHRGLLGKTCCDAMNGPLGTTQNPGAGGRPVRYILWAQVSGYFDGDGCAHVRTDSPVVLRFTLVWVDNYREQLLQLRSFLLSKSIAVGNVLVHSPGVYMLQIASPRSVLAAAKQLVPFCFKKNKELRIVIDYYEDRINGTEALLELNELVRQRLRLGKVRIPIPLPTYHAGKHQVARMRVLKWRARKSKPKTGDIHP